MLRVVFVPNCDVGGLVVTSESFWAKLKLRNAAAQRGKEEEEGGEIIGEQRDGTTVKQPQSKRARGSFIQICRHPGEAA